MSEPVVRLLSGAATDTLRCLFFHGPTWDGDVPSKTGRGELVKAGYAKHQRGWAWLTNDGMNFALDMGLDHEKDKWQQERRRAR